MKVKLFLCAFVVSLFASLAGAVTCNNNGGDAALIQTALNGGGTVTLSGTCANGGTALSMGSNTTLQGSGSPVINYTGSASAITSSGNNNTVTGVILNGGGIKLNDTSSHRISGWTITNDTFRNITNGSNAIEVAPILVGSRITGDTFFNVWGAPGGFPNFPGGFSQTNCPGSNCIGGTGIQAFRGLDSTLIDANTFDEMGANGMHLAWDYAQGGDSAYTMNTSEVTISNNTMTRVYRIALEMQGSTNHPTSCPGSCTNSNFNTGTILKSNYIHTPLNFRHDWYAFSDWTGSRNMNVYNNTAASEVSGCLVRDGIGLELGQNGAVVQGNVISEQTAAGSSCGYQNYVTVGNTPVGSTMTFNNNVFCGPSGHNSGAGGQGLGNESGSSTNGARVQVGDYFANACPFDPNVATSNITEAFTSVNNQAFPSGGNGTWNVSVISNLSIKNVQFFIDGSGTSVATQELQDVNTNFTSDRKWLYHATLNTTALSSGSHTITATATDVSGATQSATQNFTVAGAASGTTHYVSSVTGSDSNPGTSSGAPWKTLAKASAGSYGPGDSIRLKGGDHFTAEALTTPSSGSAGNPITYGAYGSGLPVIDGTFTVGNPVTISKNFITFSGIQVQNASNACILVTGSNVSVLSDVLQNCSTYAVYISLGANVLVQNSSYTSTNGFAGPTAKVFFANSTGGVSYIHNTIDMRQAASSVGPIAQVVDGGSANVLAQNTVYGGGNISQAYSIKPFGSGCPGPATAGGSITDNYADGVSSAHGDGEIVELEGCPGFHQTNINVERNVLVCYTGPNGNGNTADAIGTFYSDNALIDGNVAIGPCGYGTEPTTVHIGKAHGMKLYNNTLVGGTSSSPVAAGRRIGPEPGLPFSRVPVNHSLCEFGHITGTLLANWVSTCGKDTTKFIQNANTYLIAAAPDSESFTLFPFTTAQTYNIKHDGGQSCITGFGSGDLGLNVADSGYLSYVFGTYIPTILIPHGPGETPQYVSIDNFDDPERGFMCSGTSNWDSGFAQTDAEWNTAGMSNFFKYARDNSPAIRLDPHLGSMADWSAFPTIFQYAPSMMREWFFIGGLSGYGASTRKQNYQGLYWHQQFSNHMPEVFVGEGPRVMHWGTSLDNGDIHSALANYALVRGPNTFFDCIQQINSLSTGCDPNTWLPTANALGNGTSDIINEVVASGHAVNDGYNLMKRTFVGGVAYVNMTGTTQTITLPAGATNWGGNPISSVTLADGKGDVVLLPPTAIVTARALGAPLPNAKGIRIASSTDDITTADIQNNIFTDYSKGISVEDASPTTEDYNLFKGTVTTPFAGTMTHGGHSLTNTDPLFVSSSVSTANDVKLQAASPAIGAGQNLGSSYNQVLDPAGTVVPYPIYTLGTNWPMGAFGYSGTGATAPVILSFVANPSAINPGGSSTLTWNVTGATTLSINQGIGTVTGTSISVTPSATTVYTLTASNGPGLGIATASATVVVSTSGGGGGGGTEAWINGTSNSHFGLSVSSSLSVTAGNYLVVAANLCCGDLTQTLSVSDSNGDSFTSVAGPTIDMEGLGPNVLQVFIAKIGTTNAAETITVSSTGTRNNFVREIVEQYAGIVPSSPVDQISSVTFSYPGIPAPITVTSAATPVTQSNDLVLGIMAWGNIGTGPVALAGAGYTLRHSIEGQTASGLALEELFPSSASAQTATFSDTTLNNLRGDIVVVALKTNIASGPVIQSFVATPPSISAGAGGSVLSWSVTGATTLSINQGVGNVTGMTQVSVNPSVTTTYTLTATNAAGNAIASTTVTVAASGNLPVISAFAASPSTITSGGSSQLSWSVSGATSLSINQGIGDVTGHTFATVSSTVDTVYTLTASNSVGSVQASVPVHVLIVNTGVPVIVSFTATPDTIGTGASSQLAWVVQNARSLSIDQAVGTVTGQSSVLVSPTTTTTYTLTASNAQGSVTATVTVTISGGGAAPAILSFIADPRIITVGGSSTLRWTTNNGETSLSLDNGIGTVTGQTSHVVSPTVDTTYVLTATNAQGSVTLSVTVRVVAACAH